MSGGGVGFVNNTRRVKIGKSKSQHQSAPAEMLVNGAGGH